MPIILDDNNNTVQMPASKTIVQYSPKDYNSILTGNGINQGLLRNTLLAEGTYDTTPNHVKTTLVQQAYECTNKSYHVHDDTRSYTILHQDISLCGGYGEMAHQNQTPILPMNVLKDELMTFENPATGETLTFKSRLFVRRIYVYKGVNNYVLPSFVLVAGCVENNTLAFVTDVDCLHANNALTDPVGTIYKNIAAKIHTAAANNPVFRRFTLKTDNTTSVANNDKMRSMYDLIMSELEIIKTPGMLKDTLVALSANSFNTLRYANEILKLINISFALYQSDVIDVMNSRSATEAATLKNSNMSLSLADTLNAMQGQTAATIPELVGKHYTTKQITLTTEQIAAIESPSKITIVAAGAGTGKSSCIMHRLAFMEENGCDMKQTFVLSFTKAAAGHIKKNFKDCKSSTIAEFTHNFVNVILDDGTHTRIDIVSHSDFIQKLKIRTKDLIDAKILQQSTINALTDFVQYADAIDANANYLLDMLDINLNPEANNLLSILKMMHCSSLELDPIIFHSQLSMVKPNIEHIIIDESQDSNRLEFLTMLKMAMMNNISLYIVGGCPQTLYEFRDADPRILNNLTKLFSTYDLSINHRSTQIILDVANLMSNTMSTHKTTLRANTVMQITKQAIDDTITINTYAKVQDPATIKVLDDYLEKHLGKGESIAVIARSGQDVQKLYDYISMKYGATYNVQNITSQRRHDITILSAIGARLDAILPTTSRIPDWAAFENAIRAENIAINSTAHHSSNKYNQNGPTVNKVTLDWLAAQQADGPRILVELNKGGAARDQEIRNLQMSLLDAQTEKNNTLQRVMDAKNAKLKNQKADIVVCTVHGVKGLEYDNVACFINTEAGRSYSSSDENKRIAYVALTRAKLTECIFCTREKLVKDFEAYRAAQP